MSTIPDPAWKHVGATSNADCYAIADGILGIVPHTDTTDEENTARESIAFQDKHWRGLGRRGAVVVFMDNVIQQDAGARTVYATETEKLPTTCYALVGETFYGYATSQVFTGLSKPGLPTNVFRSLADARVWIDEMNRAHGGAV